MKRSPMKRSGFQRHRPKPNTYNTRARAPEVWWLFLKERSRCIVPELHEACARIDPARPKSSPCGGVIEADHMGERGLSHKAPDATCVPICTQHHRERTDFSGAFRDFDKYDMREFVATAVQFTQNRARYAGVEVPSC